MMIGVSGAGHTDTYGVKSGEPTRLNCMAWMSKKKKPSTRKKWLKLESGMSSTSERRNKNTSRKKQGWT